MEETSVSEILDPLEGEGETLEFSFAQIEYLRNESDIKYSLYQGLEKTYNWIFTEIKKKHNQS